MTRRHYQAICGLALIALFLLLMQKHFELLFSMLMLLVGAISILYQVRINPLFVFLPIGVGLLYEQYKLNQVFGPELFAAPGMELGDILLCVAALTYLLGQYRLHSLWFHVLPDDARELSVEKTTPAQARSEESMTPEELFWFVMPIPLFALAAQVCFGLLKQQWNLAGLPAPARQLMTETWILLLVLLVTANFFRYWRRCQMDRTAAQLLLQDVLWNETRGEQRLIHRWIVWRKLKKQEEL